MTIYQVEVTRITKGYVAVEADSYDVAWDDAQEAINDGKFVEASNQWQINAVFEQPANLTPALDATPEEVENLNAMNNTSQALIQAEPISVSPTPVTIDPVTVDAIPVLDPLAAPVIDAPIDSGITNTATTTNQVIS